MKELLRKIESLKHSDIHTTVTKRIQEFKSINKDVPNDLFIELCFCILTANFNAQRGIDIHHQLSDCFSTASKEELEKKLRQCGYRFPNRAPCIVKSAQMKQEIHTALHSLKGDELRDWFVCTIPGLGYKEASHFLRNIGFDNYAIIDSHILDLLARHQIISQPKTLTKKRYLEIEQILFDIARKTHLTLAELDLYLWYMETGKILK